LPDLWSNNSQVDVASSSDGLVIDLSRYLNGVKVDPDKKVAYVGGGALWETVDKTAIKHGLATVAGTVNHVCCLLSSLDIVMNPISICRPALEGGLNPVYPHDLVDIDPSYNAMQTPSRRGLRILNPLAWSRDR
jgi:hypothetical protein